MACRPLCAYCRQRPMEAPWAPFCSQRCKDVDLGRWLRGDYRVSEPASLDGENLVEDGAAPDTPAPDKDQG